MSAKRILFFPYSLMSHYLRCIQAARFLRNDYEILFADCPAYRNYMDAEGFRMFDAPGPDAEEVIRLSSRFDFSWLNEKTLEASFLAQLKAIEKQQPLLLAGDNSFTLRMAAEKTGIPYVSIQNAYMSKYYALLRRMSRLHPKTAQVEKLPAPLYGWLVRTAESFHMQKIHAPFRKLRKKYGLPETDTFPDELEGNFNLLCDLPEIFPQKQLPANYWFCGPLMYENKSSDESLLSELANGRQGILLSMGSSGSFASVSMFNHPDFAAYNIIAAGDHQRILNAPHIIHRSFVNARSLEGHLHLFVFHAGNGSMYEALRQGLPMLTSPFIFEQEWNEQRILELQLGESLRKAKNTSEIIALIEKWIPMGRSAQFLHFQELLSCQKPEQVICDVFSKASSAASEIMI